MKYQKKHPHAWQSKVKQVLQISLWQQFSGSLFLIFFGGIFLYFLAPEVWSYIQSVSWQPTPCKIVSSTVEHRYSTGGQKRKHSQAVIHFIYEVHNKQYQSNRYSFINPSTSGSRANNIVAKYPVGSTTTCYVNPDYPNEAVLNRQFSFFNLLILIPLPFFLLGLWGLIIFIRNFFRQFFL